MAATSSDIGDTEATKLSEMHRMLVDQYPQWDDRVEVAYPSVTALRTFRSQESRMPVISSGEPFHVKEAGEDWLMNWYLVRETGVSLFGPPPQAIIDPITREEFVRAVRKHAAAWGGGIHIRKERVAQAYSILTMCRALYSHQNGHPVSKRVAALWAQQELPEWSRLIQAALLWRRAWRQSEVDHASTYPESVRFVNFVRDQIVAGRA